jgi:hypothetical protein
MYRLIINYDDDALTIMNNVNATLKEYGVELKFVENDKANEQAYKDGSGRMFYDLVQSDIF